MKCGFLCICFPLSGTLAKSMSCVSINQQPVAASAHYANVPCLEVAANEVGLVFNPFTGAHVQWPPRVAICGVKGDTVGAFPGRHRFMGVLSVHHDLQVYLPVPAPGRRKLKSSFCAQSFGCLLLWFDIFDATLVLLTLRQKKGKGRGSKMGHGSGFEPHVQKQVALQNLQLAICTHCNLLNGLQVLRVSR